MADVGITVENLAAAVRIHADRVHDFLRRLGCSPAAAIDVLETSAADLVEAAAHTPQSVRDVVGWWFGRARALGVGAAGGSDDLPLGGGVLSTDTDQALISESLGLLPERERVAVLLCDSYALPAPSVGVTLGTDADAAMETVGRGRLRFLQAVGDELPTTSGHPVDLGALARLGMGDPVEARDATPRRHAQSCPTCRAIWATQERAHRLLSGLTVVALPESERERVLARFEQRARAALPASTLLVANDEEVLPDQPRRLLTPLYVLLGLVLAVLAGIAAGVVLSRTGSSTAAPVATSSGPSLLPSALPDPTLPVPSPPVVPIPAATSGRVFTLTPSPTATRSPTPSASPKPAPPADPLTVTRTPTSGPNGTAVTVSGTGWRPGGSVTVDYLNPIGRPTGASATQAVDVRGRFTTTVAAQDPDNLPGRHTIRVRDGARTLTTTYDVSG